MHVMEKLDWDETEEKTPVGVPGPSLIEIEVCNRIIHNEIGELKTAEDVETAVALIYALLNLSEKINISLPRLLTGFDAPSESCFCTKHVMFTDGRVSLVSTLKPPEFDYSNLIKEIYTGTIRDPLYGDFQFFNYIEQDNPESHRARWGIGESDAIKTGIIYGKFCFCPTRFLKAKEEGRAEYNHLEHWEKQLELMV